MPAENSNWTLRHRIDELDAKQDKRLQKLEKFMTDMMGWANLLGFYKDSAGHEFPCIIGRAFPKAGTIDAIVFDSGGSGGTMEITGAAYGTGNNQVRRLLSLEEEPVAEVPDEQLLAAAS